MFGFVFDDIIAKPQRASS